MIPSPAIFSHKLSRKSLKWMLLLAMLVSLAMGSVGYINLSLITQLNNVFYDYVQAYAVSDDRATQVVVVDIDDVSLEAIGQWPWPRYKVASLIQKVSAMQPAAVGLAILFAEEDRMNLANVQKVYKQDFNLDINLEHIPKTLIDSDGYLGKVLADTGAVGSQYFYFNHKRKIEISYPVPFAMIGATDQLTLHEASSVLNNVFRISSQLAYTGFLNVMRDQDGQLRRIPLLIQYQDAIYPHLALATLMRSLGVKQAVVQEHSTGLLLHVGKYEIPITRDGFMLFNFTRSAHAYLTVSALDVLNGTISSDVLRDKTIFIGSSAAAQGLFYHTAIDMHFPAVNIYGLMLDNVLHNQALIAPEWADWVTLLLCMVIAALMSIVFIFLGNIVLKWCVSLALIIFIFMVSWLSIASCHILPYPMAPTLTVLLLYMGFVIIHLMDAREAKQKLELEYKAHLENTAQQLSMQVIEKTKQLSDSNADLQASVKKLKSDTEAAAVIQQSLLPKQHVFDVLQDVDLAWAFKPCDDVGGDVLNAFALDKTHVAFFSLDVSGHGVQAAMLAVSLNLRLMERTVGGNLLMRADGVVCDPAEVVSNLNHMFPMDLDVGQYFTMTYGVYDTESRLLRYTQAGHPPMMICEPNSEVYVHEDGDLPVGMMVNAEFRTHERYAPPGTRILLYSDGIYEIGLASPVDGEAVLLLVKQGHQDSLEAGLKRLVDVVDDYMVEQALIDDVSLLSLEFH